MMLCELCLVEYVRCTGMLEVLRDRVRFVFDRMEGKLEEVVLKDLDPLEWLPKPSAQIYSIAIGQLR
jgi:hypothetical protein